MQLLQVRVGLLLRRGHLVLRQVRVDLLLDRKHRVQLLVRVDVLLRSGSGHLPQVWVDLLPERGFLVLQMEYLLQEREHLVLLLLQRGDVLLQRGDVLLQRGGVLLQTGDVLLQRGDVLLQRGDVLLQRGDVLLGRVYQVLILGNMEQWRLLANQRRASITGPAGRDEVITTERFVADPAGCLHLKTENIRM